MNADDQGGAVRALIAAREAAIASADAEAAIAPFANDVTVYDLQPPLSYSGDAARDAAELRAWLRTWRSPPKVELRDPEVHVSGDLAVAYGLALMRGEKVEEGPLRLWFRTTLAFQRSQSGWTIVHEHNSVPMKMDGSGLAAVDLEP